MEIIRNIVFVSYLKNKGVRRVCFILGLCLLLLYLFLGQKGILEGLCLFYFPFLLSIVIKWIYIGFSKNQELIESEKNKKKINFHDLNKIIWGDDSFTSLFFSYEGKIGRLKYFVAFIFINVVFGAFCRLHLLLGAVVGVLCIYSLLALIQKRSRDMDETGTKYIVSILLAILVLSIIDFFTDNEVLQIILSLIGLTGGAANLCLILFKGVENPNINRKSVLLKKPILTVFIFYLCVIVSYLIVMVNLKLDNEREKNMAIAIGAIYRHTLVYSDVCNEFGYKLNKYPVVFTNLLSLEINEITEFWKARGKNIKEMLNDVDKVASLKVKKLVREELNEIRKQFILEIVAEKYSLNDVSWDEKYNSILSMKDACLLFDDIYSMIIEEDNEGYKIIKNAVK